MAGPGSPFPFVPARLPDCKLLASETTVSSVIRTRLVGGTVLLRLGGAIIISKGVATWRDSFTAGCALPKSVCSNLVNKLALRHSARVLQFDLRRSNFVRFWDVWQVIEYSLSARVDSSIVYLTDGKWISCRLYRKQREGFVSREKRGSVGKRRRIPNRYSSPTFCSLIYFVVLCRRRLS